VILANPARKGRGWGNKCGWIPHPRPLRAGFAKIRYTATFCFASARAAFTAALYARPALPSGLNRL
jgi:hypothetical protein